MKESVFKRSDGFLPLVKSIRRMMIWWKEKIWKFSLPRACRRAYKAFHSAIASSIRRILTLPKGFFLFLLFFTSCSTSKHAVEVVNHSIRDTLYMSNIQHDSIYLHDSSSVQYRFGTIDTTVINTLGINLRVDTVYQDRMKYGYKYKLLRDTTYINRVDSIPIIKEVTVTQQVKYTPWYDRILAWVGAIVILLIIIVIVIKLTKRKIV